MVYLYRRWMVNVAGSSINHFNEFFYHCFKTNSTIKLNGKFYTVKSYLKVVWRLHHRLTACL